MVDQSSGLPSPQSEDEHDIKIEQRRDDSVTPSTGLEENLLRSPSTVQEGEQTSADEGTLSEQQQEGQQQTRRRRSSLHTHLSPRRNSSGKIICDHPKRTLSCHTLTFDRKCDWAKHVDKHDRPYKCTDSACSDLRGFTYSGGLLRHRREVHRTAGDGEPVTSTSFYCPFEYCKRSVGAGFTRRENLNEHVRRVHRSVGDVERKVVEEIRNPQDDGRGSSGIAPTPSSIPAPTEIERTHIVLPSIEELRRKRKFSEDDSDTSPGPARNIDVQGELHRLRRSNEQSAQQIERLHSRLQEKDLLIARLEKSIQLLLERRRPLGSQDVSTKDIVMHYVD